MLGGEAPREVVGLLVTCDYFDVLEQPPMIGRGLGEQDCDAGADLVAVLGYGLWREAFGGDPGVVGQTIELNRQSLRVVGVAAEGTYGGTYESAYFGPVSAQPALNPNWNLYENDNASWLFLLGRRNSPASLGQVRAELGVIASEIDYQDPGRRTTPGIEKATPRFAPLVVNPAGVLGAAAPVMTAFGLVLLVACANVANLLLARRR